MYSEHELGVIRRIKELLYDEGYTIAGAKKRLQAELEDGRSFAPPEADGEPLESEGGSEDEPPVIAVADAEPAVEPDSLEIDDPFAAREARQAKRKSERARADEAEPASAEPGDPAVDPGEAAPFKPVEEPPAAAAAEPVTAARPSRRRKTSAERAPQPSPVAVDSPVSDRVETLEHGLRRALDEVRHLRALLADSSDDR